MARSKEFKLVAVMLGLTLALGGAGASFPLLAMLLQLCGLGLIFYLVLTRGVHAVQPESRVAIFLLCATLALPLLQLAPLPPTIWRLLPGRQVPAELDALLGWYRWRPLTLDVEGTLRSFLNLLPAAAIFLGCLRLRASERVQLFWVVVTFALVGALLGTIQSVTRGSFTPYPSAHRGYAVGLFVNRNHNATLILSTMPLVSLLAALYLSRGKGLLVTTLGAIAAFVVFSVAILGTTSRMALLLLPIGLALASLLLIQRQHAIKVAVPAGLALSAVALILLLSGGFAKTLMRFSSLPDERLNYWSDVDWAFHRYGLSGTGYGTFVPVYQSAESLESVSPQIINHAHNDYFEILLEGGIPAALLFVAVLAVLGLALVRARKRGGSTDRSLVNIAAASSILLILLFSLVDYPLRMPAISGTFALLCAAILPTQTVRSSGTEVALALRPRFPLMTVTAVLMIASPALLSMQAGLSARALWQGSYASASKLAPWSTAAHQKEANRAFFLQKPRVASAEAARAVALSPINAPAIRTLGLVRLSNGETVSGNRLMRLAAALGWRDLPTQLWAIDAAKKTGELEKAVDRAEGLLRQQTLAPAAVLQLLDAPDWTTMRALLVERVAERPAWRSTFLDAGKDLPAAELDRWAEVIQSVSGNRAPLTISDSRTAVQTLVERGRLRSAQLLWQQTHGRSFVTNGSFDEVDDSSGAPKYWKLASENLANVVVEQPEFSPGDHALRITANGEYPGVWQDLMLKPGSYDLSLRAAAGTPSAATVQWQLVCDRSWVGDRKPLTIRPGKNWEKARLSFTVPDQDCPIQRLEIVRAQAMPRGPIWLDDIALTKGFR
ncbi:MAG TPA: O-antigen ligase family protein [Sphingomicrobium sp.]|jgi:O-antigen ligase